LILVKEDYGTVLPWMETLKENNNKTSDLTTIPLAENPPINID
jgi:hypothetical protein